MNLYPTSISSALHFDKIKQLVYDNCLSEIGKYKITQQSYFDNMLLLEKELKKILEYKNILSFKIDFPCDHYHDLKSDLVHVHIENYILDAEQFHRIKSSVQTIESILSFFKSRDDKNEFKNLETIIRSAFFDKKIISIIDRVIDEKGYVKSSASRELQEVRIQIQSKFRQIERAYQTAYKELSAKGFLGDTEETVRNGRRVFAVLSEHKRSFSGIIHDESDTGKTTYIEPEQVVFLNNQLYELELEEKKEIRKVLKVLTADIAVYKNLLEDYQEILATYDAIRAKAKLAVLLNANLPKISSTPKLKLKDAYHPLLKIQNTASNKPTIPFSIEIGGNQKIVLISGPNAGGKSVTMNAIGLLVMMLQYGLLIPVDEQSEFYLFDQIFADVGDAQSIEDELSTYSSKLRYMNHFIQNADENTLILIDEMGSGTDPLFGGAMAEAVLMRLIEKKSLGVATTHFGNLKTFGDRNGHILNACMLFDEVQLAPTYKLSTGKPGSSYTFEIAQKSGLDKKLIDYAKSLSNTEQVKYDALLNKLEQREVALNKEIDQLKLDQKSLQDQMKKWQKLNQDLDISRKRIQYERLTERNAVEHEKNKKLREYLEEIKKSKKEDELIAEKKKIEQNTIEQSTQMKQLFKKIHQIDSDQKIEIGSKVKYIETQISGIVEQIKGKKAVVLFGNMRSQIPISDLIINNDKDHGIGLNKRKIDLSDQSPIARELDLRGKFQNEAVEELEQFIDKALVNNLWQFKIIHGTGVLKKAVWNVLKSIPQIEKFNFADEKSGGEGATIVTL